jgi:hypothetical protein
MIYPCTTAAITRPIFTSLANKEELANLLIRWMAAFDSIGQRHKYMTL